MYKLALVGRPNVGKSALFNRICRKRISIVDEAEGITRDRIYGDAENFGFHFQVIDTGGIDPKTQDRFKADIRRQAEIAIKEADSLVLVVDGRMGPTALDYWVAAELLKLEKPLTLAVNKIDDLCHLPLLAPFYKLNIPKVIGVSAAHGFQIADLLELAFEGFLPNMKEESTGVKISIVGRTNVGKSTFVNSLLQEERCLVSELAGTTRDSVDIPLVFNDKPYVFIDTAGIRRKKSEKETVEKFAAIRTENAIEKSDICLLMLDVQEGLTSQEKRIASFLEKSGKACIILMNKWDLAKGFRMEHAEMAIKKECPFLAHCPLLFISAKSGRNLEKIFSEIDKLYTSSQTRVSTHQLNKFLERSIQLNHPPMITGKRLRIYYMTQVESSPPRFILFVNYPELMTGGYKKYLLNQFRSHFGFEGMPLFFHLRGKQREKKEQ